MAASRKAPSFAQLQTGKWRPLDDLKLIEACKQTNDIREVFLGQRFSCKVSQSDIEQRWRMMLHHSRVSKLAALKLTEWSSNTSNALELLRSTPFSVEEERLLATECDAKVSELNHSIAESTRKNQAETAKLAHEHKKFVSPVIEAVFDTYRDEFAPGRKLEDVLYHYEELAKAGLLELFHAEAEKQDTEKEADSNSDERADAKRGRYEVDANGSPFLDALHLANETTSREIETFLQAFSELDSVYASKQLSEFDARYFANSLLVDGLSDGASVSGKASQPATKAEAEKTTDGESEATANALECVSEQVLMKKSRAEFAAIARLERELEALRRLLRQSQSQSATASTHNSKLLATLDDCVTSVFETDFGESTSCPTELTSALPIPLDVILSSFWVLPPVNFAIFVLSSANVIKRERGKSTLLVMRKPRVSIGRRSAGSDENVEVDFDLSPYTVGRKVSRKHVEVSFDERSGQFSLRNCGTRPVFVDGAVTCSDERRALNHGAVIEFCDLLLQFRVHQRYL